MDFQVYTHHKITWIILVIKIFIKTFPTTNTNLGNLLDKNVPMEFVPKFHIGDKIPSNPDVSRLNLGGTKIVLIISEKFSTRWQIFK